MTTLTINKNNFGTIMEKLYWIVSLEWKTVILNYEIEDKLEISSLSVENEKKLK